MARSETAFLDEGEGKPIVLVHGFASNMEVHWIYHRLGAGAHARRTPCGRQR
jgi:hypothetical protein